jgi:hypothetical protein
MVLIITEQLRKKFCTFYKIGFRIKIILSVHFGARRIINTIFDTEYKLQHKPLII